MCKEIISCSLIQILSQIQRHNLHQLVESKERARRIISKVLQVQAVMVVQTSLEAAAQKFDPQ